MNKDSNIKHLDFVVIDLFSFLISFLIACLVKFDSFNLPNNEIYLNVVLWIIVIDILFIVINNPYKDVLKRSNFDEIKVTLVSTTVNLIIITIIFYLLKIGSSFSRLTLAYTYVFYFVLSIVLRVLWKRIVRNRLTKYYDSAKKNVLIVCYQKDVESVTFNVSNSDYKEFNIKGLCIVDSKGSLGIIKKYKTLCDKNEILKYAIDNKIDTVFIFTKPNIVNKKVIEQLIQNGIEVQLDIRKIYDFESESEEIGKIGLYNTIKYDDYVFSSAQNLYFVIKRVLDIIFSLLGCLLLIPIIMLVKVVYLLDGDSYPIIYTHERVGKNGKLFNLYKFRSMIPNSDKVLSELLKNEKIKKQWDKNQKLDNDPRITKIGNFLRKTSIDELPQFINVLLGDMSIIGPRPLVVGELEKHNGIKLYEKVKPGITGWWGCNGRSIISYEDRLDLEYYYVKNCSFYLDVLCVIKTIYVVIFRKGAK